MSELVRGVNLFRAAIDKMTRKETAAFVKRSARRMGVSESVDYATWRLAQNNPTPPFKEGTQ